MLGSVFLGFPQTQDFVSSLTSASLKEPVAGGSPPPTSTSWQSDEHQKPYRSTKNRLSWRNWLASGLGRKENELLDPGYSESRCSGQPAPSSLLYSNHKAEGQSWFCLLLLSTPCCTQKHSSSCSLFCFFSLSPSRLHLYVTSLREPPWKPRHGRRIPLLLYFPFVWLWLFVELLSSPMHSRTRVCDPDLRNGHP